MLTLVLVVFGWVFFRSTDLPHALSMIGHMLLPDFGGLGDVVSSALTNQRLVILLLALTVFALPAHPVTGPLLEAIRNSAPAGGTEECIARRTYVLPDVTRDGIRDRDRQLVHVRHEGDGGDVRVIEPVIRVIGEGVRPDIASRRGVREPTTGVQGEGPVRDVRVESGL